MTAYHVSNILFDQSPESFILSAAFVLNLSEISINDIVIVMAVSVSAAILCYEALRQRTAK